HRLAGGFLIDWLGRFQQQQPSRGALSGRLRRATTLRAELRFGSAVWQGPKVRQRREPSGRQVDLGLGNQWHYNVTEWLSPVPRCPRPVEFLWWFQLAR